MSACHAMHSLACMCVCRATAGLAGAPPGNLTFSSDFEGGNIGFACAADNGLEYDINVRQDTYGPKHRLWFHFQMRGATQGTIWLYLHWSGKVRLQLLCTKAFGRSHSAEIILQNHPAEPIAIWSDSERVQISYHCKASALQQHCIAAAPPCWLSQLCQPLFFIFFIFFGWESYSLHIHATEETTSVKRKATVLLSMRSQDTKHHANTSTKYHGNTGTK
jgi:hypothetical protein